MSLELCPVTLREANAYVERHHRHHGASRGCIFCVAVDREAEQCEGVGRTICGVAIVGRPVNRVLQDGYTAEVTRCCTDGTKNAASKLYAAAWRACRAIGYRRLVTYTLASEPGTSLEAAGFQLVGEVKGRSWHTPSRPRVDLNPAQSELKFRWERAA